MHRIPRTNLVFVHIPKTAGIAVRKAFGMKSQTAAHSITTENDKKLMAPRFVRFCVVRHPIERFVSAYLYNLWYVDKLETGIKAEIKRVGATTDINVLIDAFRRGETDITKSSHFKPQTEFIRKTQPEIILRHENLARDIKIVAQLAGRPDLELPTANTTSERAADLAHVNVKISKQNMAFLREFYRDDFQSLGYRAVAQGPKAGRKRKPADAKAPPSQPVPARPAKKLAPARALKKSAVAV
jgi:hypothetical protein